MIHKEKHLAVLVFVHLYNRERKGLRAQEIKFLLSQSGLAWDGAIGPFLEPLLGAAGMQRGDSGTKQCGGRSSQGWVGKRSMRTQAQERISKEKEKILPSFHTKTLRMSERVFGSKSGPMLLGSVNSFCNFL